MIVVFAQFDRQDGEKVGLWEEIFLFDPSFLSIYMCELAS